MATFQFSAETEVREFDGKVWVSASSLLDVAEEADKAGCSQAAQVLRQAAAGAYQCIENKRSL